MTVLLAALSIWFQARLPDTTLSLPGAPQVSRLSPALDPRDLPADLPRGAVFLHRVHRLGALLPGLAVLNSHDGFDAALTTGSNMPLAERLRWHEPERAELERASGLIALPPQQDWGRLLDALHAEFGGQDALLPPKDSEVRRMALMDAMRPELLEAVAANGVSVYITGQMRPAALPTARALSLGVIALGPPPHRTLGAASARAGASGRLSKPELHGLWWGVTPLLLDVRPAALPDLSPVLRASALSFEQRGLPMWTQDSLTPERLNAQYARGQGYLGCLESQPVAAMILIQKDSHFWPDDPAGEALYLHKLAVHPGWQGRGLGAQMIAAAILETRTTGRPWLRLDTAAERPKLRAVYEAQGFQLVREGQMDGWPIAWYELKV